MQAGAVNLRVVPKSGSGNDYYDHSNPEPCGCCRHGHSFSVSVLTVRRGRDGAILKVLDAASTPSGYEERKQ